MWLGCKYKSMNGCYKSMHYMFGSIANFTMHTEIQYGLIYDDLNLGEGHVSHKYYQSTGRCIFHNMHLVPFDGDLL